MTRARRPSGQMRLLLRALADRSREWRYGYDLMKEIGVQSGTLYRLLMRMTEQGLVEAQWCEPERVGRPPRHAYRLTTAGLALARAVADAGSAPTSQVAPA